MFSSRQIFSAIVWLIFALGGVLSCFAANPAGAGGIVFERLTTNGRANPLGISAEDASFSWSARSPARGMSQKAYQVRVGKAAGGGDVWDSGQVDSARQIDVALPSSATLLPATRYCWQVRIWDQNGNRSDWSEPAWFETGLLTKADWAGAEWIARPRGRVNPAAWTNYSVTIDFTLESGAFGVFLRSSADGRNAFMMQVNVAGAAPVFKPHRRTAGAYAVLAMVDLSQFGFSNAALTGTRNTLKFDVSGTTITTMLNGVTIDTRTGIDLPGGLVGFRTDGTESAVVHRVTVADKATGDVLIDSDFSRGRSGFSGGAIMNDALVLTGSIDAVFANLPPSLPLLRGKFVAKPGIVAARLYASAQGLYEVEINGQKAGDSFLAPGWTDYDKRIQSQTYDITPLVQPGDNGIGAALADGWYRGKVGLGWRKVYGDDLAFIAKIKITYADGSSDWFSTGSSWRAGCGPYVRADLQDGESYDASFEAAGWSTAEFDDSEWCDVTVATNVSARLVPQPDEPVRKITELTAKRRMEIQPQTWLYDFGQNMVGVARIVLSGAKGQTVVIRHAEEVYRTGPKTGQIYADNFRTAKVTDTYTFKADGTFVYQPKFTQHGFRYVEITGTATPPAAEDVKGIVLSSDLRSVGELQTSSALLNQLVSNIRWGQRGNFLSIPTDTPARDERLGWTGDISVFARAAARYADTRAFLSKWMTDVRDSQKPNGNIPAVVPQPRSQFDESGVGWSDAVITVPYAVWQASGDESIIRANWAAMKAFYNFVRTSATADGDLLEQGRSSWFSGDWLSLETGWNRLEEHKVIATAYFAEDTRMMAEMAAVMGEKAEAARWAALVPQIRAAFVAAYCSPDGAVHQGTQTAYALALGMDMISDPVLRAKTAGKFVRKLAADGNHLRTGFLGTPWLLPALTRIGRDDLAMRVLLNEDYPSWGFPIKMGATTMWERWNSIQPSGEFGPVDMNSFNHYAYGAVGDWMFENLGGLQALEPGYKKSRIAPLMGRAGLTQARCVEETSYGRLAADWRVAGASIALKVQVPFNTTAFVSIPAKDRSAVSESGIPAGTSAGVKFLRMEKGSAVYEVGSGSYDFTSQAPPLAQGLLTAAAGSGQVDLSWQAAPFASGYTIKRATSAGGPYTTIAANVHGTSFTDARVIRGVQYHYVVTATNSTGESGASNEVAGMPAD